MQGTPFTIEFLYDIIEDSIRVRLKADVWQLSDNLYNTTNMKRANFGVGPIIPAFNVLNAKGHWVDEHGKKETDLSLAIGRSIARMHAQKISFS